MSKDQHSQRRAALSGSSRRQFLQTTGATAAVGITAPYFFTASRALAEEAKNERPLLGLIGAGGQGTGIAHRAKHRGDFVAVADVNSNHANNGKQQLSGGKADTYEDYRKLLDRKDIEAVLIGTPDHWHTKICIEAMQAGKDVYCEKPLTLTIDEGKLLCKVAKETGRVFQVGTQQRSDSPELFVRAIALCREGRLGKINRVTAAIGGGPAGGPFQKTTPPDHLNFDMWLGQAPLVEYIPQRASFDFRWWYEYSGGKMTDWGAHHVDIAHWALNKPDTNPVSIEGTAKHPVPFEKGYPTVDDRFNTATEFLINCKFEDGTELVIRHDTDNGVLIEGDKGRIFVNRGKLVGAPVDELKDNPLPEDAMTKVYKGKQPGDHMRNFFECIKDRSEPISDPFSHHRALATCHLANIAIRLDRPLKYDPAAEQIVGDEEANGFLKREQRSGYEIKV